MTYYLATKIKASDIDDAVAAVAEVTAINITAAIIVFIVMIFPPS